MCDNLILKKIIAVAECKNITACKIGFIIKKKNRLNKNVHDIVTHIRI